MEKSKSFILLCILSFCLFLSCQAPKTTEEASEKKPNIVFIYLDDLGYGDVSAYKSGTLQTPNMDKLANEGLRFTNGYASSATCTPSRYALLTGTYPGEIKTPKSFPVQLH